MRKINTRNFHRATRETPREINRQILLNLIRDHQPISRAELARRMGVERSMVSSLVRALLAEELVCEGATASAPRGRKPTLLHIRAHDRMAIGIDVHLSRTYVLLSDLEGREIAREVFATPSIPEELVAELALRIRRLLEAHRGTGHCLGVGLVVPGVVDPRTGVILQSASLGWRGVDLRARLVEEVGLPVHIDRDAVAGALAQLWFGRRERDSLESFVYVTVSDGIGVGMVLNGQVVRGHRSMAGEFGHVPLGLDGPECACGARGCWEAYASAPATIARFVRLSEAARSAPRRPPEDRVALDDVISAARAGNAEALAALRETGRYVGVGLAMIFNSLDPTRVIVGGELTAAWDLMAEEVHSALRQRVLGTLPLPLPIRVEAGELSLRLRGATALVIATAFAAPAVG